MQAASASCVFMDMEPCIVGYTLPRVASFESAGCVGCRQADLVRLDLVLNGDPVDALARVVHRQVMLCYVVLCCAVLCCAVLCCAVLRHAVLCCAMLCFVALCCVVCCAES